MRHRRRQGFYRSESGAVLALYALALPALVVVAGVAFDYARIAGLDSELQNAADQAALAGATQLDGDGETSSGAGDGACQRAIDAAQGGLVSNITRMSSDVGVSGKTTAVGVPTFVFYEDRADAEADTNSFTVADSDCDTKARFVGVTVENRIANYAFTPLAGVFFGDINAGGVAGLGSSVCRVPPLMICHPDPTATINWDLMEGTGIQATGHNPGNSGGKGGSAGSTTAGGTTWSPGNFGFLQVEDPNANNTNAALLRALAYVNPPIDCTRVDENKVSTGNPQGLYDAINTRFDIYDFPNNSGGGNVLSSCQSGSCPPSTNVVKDLQTDGSGANACKMNTNGWHMPENEFYPIATPATIGGNSFYQDSNHDGTAGDFTKTVSHGSGGGGGSATTYAVQMGLPRDLCHYTTYNGTGFCGASESTGRFGNKVWARADYFRANYGSNVANWPSGWNTMTRYETYKSEIAGVIPNTSPQRGTPICFSGSGADPTRRVLTVAVVTNCSELNGTSKPVDIDEWVDVFLVEPATDDSKRHNAYKDAIYVEVIGKSKLAGDGTYASQLVRRDVPFLVR